MPVRIIHRPPPRVAHLPLCLPATSPPKQETGFHKTSEVNRHIKLVSGKIWEKPYTLWRGLKFAKDGIVVIPTGAGSCFSSTVNSISHVRSLHLGKLGWMSGTSSTPSTTGSTKASIFQPWSHTKNLWVSKQKNHHQHVHQLQELNEVRRFVPGCWDCRWKKNIRTW